MSVLEKGDDGIFLVLKPHYIQPLRGLVDPYPVRDRPIKIMLTQQSTTENLHPNFGSNPLTRPSDLYDPKRNLRAVLECDIPPPSPDLDIDKIL